MADRASGLCSRRVVGDLILTLCGMVPFLLLAPVLPAQGRTALSGADCGRAAGDPCRTAIVTEASYGLLFVGGLREWGQRINVTTSLGFVEPVRPRLGLGAVVTAGLWNNLYLAVGPRLRYQATPTTAVDLTPSYVVRKADARTDGKGRVVLDGSVMYRDGVGLSIQATSYRPYDYGGGENPMRSTMLVAGLRLGSKPGRLGILANAVALLTVVVVALATVGDE